MPNVKQDEHADRGENPREKKSFTEFHRNG